MLRKSIGRGKKSSRLGTKMLGTPQDQSTVSSPATRDVIERARPNFSQDANEVARYFQKAPRLLEDFFVIGVSQEDIKTLREGIPQQRPLPQDLYHPARLLYS